MDTLRIEIEPRQKLLFPCEKRQVAVDSTEGIFIISVYKFLWVRVDSSVMNIIFCNVIVFKRIFYCEMNVNAINNLNKLFKAEDEPSKCELNMQKNKKGKNKIKDEPPKKPMKRKSDQQDEALVKKLKPGMF